jgi:5-hydroxyisourate hydrolase-like protein (transthyretin family)
MKRAVYFCLLLLSWAPHGRGAQTNSNNRMGRLRNLQGVVLDVQNLPVTDTVVRLWNDPERKQMILEGKTDADGRFRLPNLRRGTYFIEFLTPGFHSYLTEIHVSSVSSATGLVISPLLRGVTAAGGS